MSLQFVGRSPAQYVVASDEKQHDIEALLIRGELCGYVATACAVLRAVDNADVWKIVRQETGNGVVRLFRPSADTGAIACKEYASRRVLQPALVR